jgi:hypothetical protein
MLWLGIVYLGCLAVFLELIHRAPLLLVSKAGALSAPPNSRLQQQPSPESRSKNGPGIAVRMPPGSRVPVPMP